MKNPTKQALHFASVCLLAFLRPVDAKLNTNWVTAEADTLYLKQNEMRDFYANKRIGEDLSNIGLLLSCSAIPSYLYALHLADGGNTAAHFNRINLVESIYAGGVFPVCAMIMAIGNIQFKKAAQKDYYVENSLTKSWLPYIVSTASIISISLLSSKILFTDCYHASQPQEYSDKCNDNPAGIIGVSTFITIPWLRYQFGKSRLHLDGLEIRPTPESQKISFEISFD